MGFVISGGILKKYIEDTSRMRHDFLHTARTAVTLAQNNEIDTLVKFLEDYGVSVEESHSRKIFCEHDALNAIIAYYYDMVKKQDIKCIWQIAIPNKLSALFLAYVQKNHYLCTIITAPAWAINNNIV